MKLIGPLDGLLNCTVAVLLWPGARLDTIGKVTKELPLNTPVPFTTVTPAVRDDRTRWIGAMIALLPIFLTVTVPLKVCVIRLYARPDVVVMA